MRQRHTRPLTLPPADPGGADLGRWPALHRSVAVAPGSADTTATSRRMTRSSQARRARRSGGSESLGSWSTISFVVCLPHARVLDTGGAAVTAARSQGRSTDTAGRRDEAGPPLNRTGTWGHPSAGTRGDALLARSPPARDERAELRQAPGQGIPPFRGEGPGWRLDPEPPALQHRDRSCPQQVLQQPFRLATGAHSDSSQDSQVASGSGSASEMGCRVNT